MRTKYYIYILASYFVFLLSIHSVAQENEINYPHQHNFPEIEFKSGEFDQAMFSPEATFYNTSVSDFRVNEQVGNSTKNNINSAMNNNGISLIVWSDFREGTSNVYAQLVGLNGQVVGENIKVNFPEDGKAYSYPDVEVSENNQFLVIWADARSGYTIYGQIIDEDGILIDENFKVGDEDNNSFKYQTCIGSNGNEFIVAWLDGRGGSNYDIYAQRLYKDGTKIGNNFIVNSDSQGVRKSFPDVSIKSDGSIIATWYSNIEGRNNIYAVLLDNQNNLVGSQFQVSDSTLEISNNYNSVSASCKTGYIVAWYRYFNNDYNIIAQYIDTASAKIDSNFIVNSDYTSSQYFPAVASDTSGNFTISWYDYRNGYAQIYAQEFANDTLAGDNFKVSEDEMVGAKREVSCAIDNDGNLITSWLDLMEPTEYRIYSRTMGTNNEPISSSIRIDDDSYSSTEQFPSIEVFEDGTSIVAWSDKRNRSDNSYIQKYDASGIAIGSNIPVISSGAQYDAKVTKLTDNNFIVMWREYYRGTLNQNEIVAQKYFKTGEKLGEKIIVSSNEIKGNASSFDGSSNSNGEFALVFQKRINGYNRIYAQKFNSDGSAIGGNILVSQDSTTHFYKPKVALDSLGNFAVVYYGNIGNGNDIFLRRFTNEGVEIDSLILVNDDENFRTQYNPDISINNKGECIIVWFDYRNTNGAYFQKYKNIGSESSFEKIDSNIAVTDYSFGFSSPSVFLNNIGEFVISWAELNSPYYDLKFRIFDSNTMPITEVLYATENRERNQINQDIHFSADKIYNVWQDNREEGIGYDIWANIFDYQDLVTDVDNKINEVPTEFVLNQNYPNPFNPTTTIKYSVPNGVSGINSEVNLKIFDVLGREIRTLVNKDQNPGNYEIKFDANDLTSGIYFYSLKVGKIVKTKKMMLLK